MIPPEKETKNLKNKMEKLRRKLKVINQNTIIWGDFSLVLWHIFLTIALLTDSSKRVMKSKLKTNGFIFKK